jgi:hypothetical protein
MMQMLPNELSEEAKDDDSHASQIKESHPRARAFILIISDRDS